MHACAAFPTVELYRALNVAAHDHFYTTSLPELGHAAPAYKREQSCGRVLATDTVGAGAVPLFRLWNPRLADHFFTTDAHERKVTLASGAGWLDEGVAAYVLERPRCGTIALYRLFHGAGHDHFYTTDAGEMASAITKHGYTFEAVIGYVWPH